MNDSTAKVALLSHLHCFPPSSLTLYFLFFFLFFNDISICFNFFFACVTLCMQDIELYWGVPVCRSTTLEEFCCTYSCVFILTPSLRLTQTGDVDKRKEKCSFEVELVLGKLGRLSWLSFCCLLLHFAHSFILLTWPPAAPISPLPLFVPYLDYLIKSLL